MQRIERIAAKFYWLRVVSAGEFVVVFDLRRNAFVICLTRTENSQFTTGRRVTVSEKFEFKI